MAVHSLGTLQVDHINGIAYAIVSRNERTVLAGRIPPHIDTVPLTVEAREWDEAEGLAIECRIDDRWQQCEQYIFGVKQAGESDADVVDRLGLDESSLLPKRG